MSRLASPFIQTHARALFWTGSATAFAALFLFPANGWTRPDILLCGALFASISPVLEAAAQGLFAYIHADPISSQGLANLVRLKYANASRYRLAAWRSLFCVPTLRPFCLIPYAIFRRPPFSIFRLSPLLSMRALETRQRMDLILEQAALCRANQRIMLGPRRCARAAFDSLRAIEAHAESCADRWFLGERLLILKRLWRASRLRPSQPSPLPSDPQQSFGARARAQVQRALGYSNNLEGLDTFYKSLVAAEQAEELFTATSPLQAPGFEQPAPSQRKTPRL